MQQENKQSTDGAPTANRHKQELFYKYVCDYILENITATQLINVALECLANGIESDSLYIIAGLNDKFDTYWDIQPYYESALKELNITEPSKNEAAKYLTAYYCKNLIEKKILPKKFLEKIKNEIYDKTYADNDNIKYLGDYLDIEAFLMIYYMIDDIKYSITIKNKMEKIEEEYKLCYEEAETYLRKSVKSALSAC